MKNAIRIAGVATLACLVIGCSSGLSYQLIHLGDGPKSYQTVLPAADTRETDLGRSYISTALDGGTTAIIVRLTENRLVSAKVLFDDRPLRSPRVLAEVRVDRQLYGVDQAGPLDTLRLLASELAEPVDGPEVRRAHDAALGVVLRMISAWPGGGAIDLPDVDVAALVAPLPADGTLTFEVTPRGLTYRFE